jgi:hypothetical protein
MKMPSVMNRAKRAAYITPIIAGCLAIAACESIGGGPSGPKGGRNNPYIIAFSWQNADPCKVDPASVTPEPTTCVDSPQTDFCIGRNKWVEWQSMPAKKYDIYFSPFVASSVNAGNNGKAKKRISDSAPYGYYKYTILADNCNADTDAFDPRMRVDN